MNALFSRGYQVMEADIRMGSGGDPVEVYAASELKEVLADPSILRKEAPPPLWAARDEGEKLLAGGKSEEAYDVLKGAQDEFSDDPGMRALLAEAAMLTGRHDEAIALAGELCKEDRAYCALRGYLGRIREDMGGGRKEEPRSLESPEG
jgi:predicted Zn-dependent protease